MGQDKASLPHPAGGSFLGHAVGRLTGLCDQVCVAGGSNLGMQVELLEDPRPDLGPAIGIAAAMSYAAARTLDACLVTPVDMPLLTVEDLTRIRDAWEESGDLCCAQSAADGRLQPLVAVYPLACRKALQELAESDDRSLTRWLAKRRPQAVGLSCESCRNINRPQDLDA